MKSSNPSLCFILWAIAMPEGPAPMIMASKLRSAILRIWLCFGRLEERMRSRLKASSARSISTFKWLRRMKSQWEWYRSPHRNYTAYLSWKFKVTPATHILTLSSMTMAMSEIWFRDPNSVYSRDPCSWSAGSPHARPTTRVVFRLLLPAWVPWNSSNTVAFREDFQPIK